MSTTPVTQRQSRMSADIGLAALLGLVLLLISYARLIGDMGSAAFNMSLVENALTVPFWQTRLAFNIVVFVLAMLMLHVVGGIACWVLSVLTTRAFPAIPWSRRQWTCLWFIAGTAWVLVANAANFAHSSLGEPYHGVATTRVLGVTPYALFTVCMLAALALVAVVFLYREKAWRRASYLLLGSASMLLAGGFTWNHVLRHRHAASQSAHIILIGIDSLRPDFVNGDSTPHVRGFMDGAVQMQDAVTPLARTFPSWISVLTGRHPHTTGAYMNLLPRELINTGTTLPGILREHGYRTYYAIDETRFANIDASYGFDRTMTSTIGGSDFVLAWFADTPLSNVVMNTWIGRLLFPHVHANRAAHVTYDPDSFVRRVAGALDPRQPVFLAAHLTLPHWPYLWSASNQDEPKEDNIEDLYTRAVQRADQQFGDLLAALERRGVLDNAIVIALSDHGEALGRADDFMSEAYPDKKNTRPREQVWGHGTSVFSPSQYRVVLGIAAYGKARSLMRQPTLLDEPVSLVDLAPTVLDLLEIESREAFDGMSLACLMRNTVCVDGMFEHRIRFTENEYNPRGFLPDNLTASALSEAIKVYRLDAATDRLLVRDNMIESILSNRQYAALLGKRAMAVAMPSSETDGHHEFVFVPDPAEPAARSINAAVRLREALQDRFDIRLEGTLTD